MADCIDTYYLESHLGRHLEFLEIPKDDKCHQSDFEYSWSQHSKNIKTFSMLFKSRSSYGSAGLKWAWHLNLLSMARVKNYLGKMN